MGWQTSEAPFHMKPLCPNGHSSGGVVWMRNRNDCKYIVDFYCLDRGVVIEIDSSSHDEKAGYDAERDAFLMGLGIVVIHYFHPGCFAEFGYSHDDAV